MAASFPPTDPELSTCGEEADGHTGEDMDEEPGLAVHLGTVYSCRKADGTYHDAEVVKTRTNKRAKREEYMVRYVGMTRRQTEWVDKTRLVLLKPQKDEEAEEDNDQEMSEKGQTLRDQKPDEDEPETKKVKVEVSEAAASTSMMPSLAEELTCLLCSRLYEDPVMVECGHNFCRSCVDKAWADEDSFTCPDCEEYISEKRYTTNRTLVNLLKKATATPAAGASVMRVKNCAEHEEKVKLYCKDDGTLSCVICQDSLKHANHSFLSILEADGVYRAKLSSMVNPLEEALTKTKEMAAQYWERIENHQTNMSECRQNLVSAFEKMYNFLSERKEELLEQLQEQGHSVQEDMEANVGRLSESRDNLRDAVAMVKEKVDDTNSYSFLTGFKQFLKKLKEQKKAATSSGTALVEEMSHGTFNGPIQYIIWRQMESLIGPVPECDEQPVPSGNAEETETAAPEDNPVPEDAVKESEQQPEPEEDDDEEEAAEVPEDASGQKNALQLEDYSDLMDKEQKEIWIVGDGYVAAVNRQAEKGPYGTNLGFPKSVCNVRWLNMTKAWSVLLSRLKKDVVAYKRPDVLFLHLGNYELAHKSFKTMNTSVQRDLDNILKLFPRVDIILSTVLPKKEWLGSPLEHNRKSFNATLRRYAGKHRFQVVKHEELEMSLFDRFEEGVESLLNASDCDVFIKSMREALLKELRGRKKASDREQQNSDGTMESHRRYDQPRSPVDSETTSQGGSSEPKNIWIVGNAYIYRAYGHAGKRPLGHSLGFKDRNCNVRWLGRTTRWHRLLPELQKSVGPLGMPDAIFLHLGTEDLELTSYEALINDMRNCLGRLTHLFRKVKLILSTVFPKAEWLGSQVEDCRRMFNTRLARYAERHGFQLVTHERIEQKILARFRGRDYNNFLSTYENDLFLYSIRDALNEAFKDCKTVTEKYPEKATKSSEEGTSTKRDQLSNSSDKKKEQAKPSAEKDQERVQSSARKESETDVTVTECEQEEASLDTDEALQGSDIPSDNKLILVVGNSYIFKASGHAGKASYGLNLGFGEQNWTVRWVGRVMRWLNLIPSVKKYTLSNVKPSAIFLYLGGNDLSHMDSGKFIGEVRYYVGRLTKIFPKAQIVLSTVLPKAEWMGNNLEKLRKKVNEELPQYASKEGFEFVSHGDLEEKLVTRYKEGDASSLLSASEMEDFIANIRGALLKAMQKGERVAIETDRQEDADERGRDSLNESSSEMDPAHSDQQTSLDVEEDLGDPASLPEHKIWIVGNTYVRALHMHALNSSWGQNLGLERRNWTLHWLGKIMQWCELLPKMRDASHLLGAPSAIFIHLGSNDLGQCRIRKLMGDARSCLGQLVILFPNTQFIISPVLPRAEWLDKPLEGCRKKLNASLTEYAKKCGHEVAAHEPLEKMRLARFKGGNQNGALSANEKEVFMKTLRDSLLKAMLKDHRAVPGTHREPQQEVLSSGATFYFVPGTDERRAFLAEAQLEEERAGTDESKSSIHEDSDRDEDSDQDEAEQDKCMMDIDERRTSVLDEEEQEEAEQDEEDVGSAERRSSLREETEPTQGLMDTDQRRSSVQEEAEEEDSEQDEDMMECDQPKKPDDLAHPVDSPAHSPVQEKSGGKQVWIVGSSFLCRAMQHAQSRPYGQNLGFDENTWTVRWMGCIGMRWEALAEEVDKAKYDYGAPSVMVIHLGGNDLGRMPYKLFFKAVKYDFRRFAKQFPKTQVIYSTILPRSEWLTTPVDQVRMKFNESIVKCSWNLGFHVLMHNNIEEKVKARFKSGRGNDLSDMEYHLLLTSIRDAVQKVLDV